ncbi:hypothetical protein ACFVH0_13175 [Streptomyces sp. NPDC127117]|uniref:hypothetical protein n=1 Tax=Streptomyces sp. NPDC127117 TaxID=3345368 RepID=UPI0036289692
MTVPYVDPQPEVQIVEVDILGTDLLAIVVRCLATTRLGARFHCVSPHGRAVDLTLTEIRRYPRVTVTEVDPPHAARLVLTGTGASELHLHARDVLQGINPVA